MRRLGQVLLAIVASTAGAQSSWTRVTYISGASVYVEAGANDGLAEGSRLEVVRGGSVIADLVVTYLSPSRASCSVSQSVATPVVGDSVRFTAKPMAAPVTSAPAPGGVVNPGVRRMSVPSRLRGRLGVRYLVSDPGSDAGPVMTQPALDLRIDGQHLGGSAFGLGLDARAVRSAFSSTPATGTTPPATNVTRIYQASVQWNPVGSRTTATLGRQFAIGLPSVGLFDGAAINRDGARWSAGALVGLQPEPLHLGLSTDIRQGGGYLQVHSAQSASLRWSLTAGGVGSYDRGSIDREFVYLQTTFNAPRVSGFVAQEVDVNRGWKSAQEGSAMTPTSTFAIVQVAVTEWLSVNGGMDNRRNVRLYRDYQNPVTTFDDSFREGAWGGASLTIRQRVRLSSDARTSTGGGGGTTQAFTNSLSVMRLTPLAIGLHARDTRFTGQSIAGQLQSASVDISPLGLFRLELNGGRRTASNPQDGGAPTHLTWTGLDVDVGLGRSIYLLISASRESGTLDHRQQSSVMLSYRF